MKEGDEEGKIVLTNVSCGYDISASSIVSQFRIKNIFQEEYEGKEELKEKKARGNQPRGKIIPTCA